MKWGSELEMLSEEMKKAPAHRAWKRLTYPAMAIYTNLRATRCCERSSFLISTILFHMVDSQAYLVFDSIHLHRNSRSPLGSGEGRSKAHSWDQGGRMEVDTMESLFMLLDKVWGSFRCCKYLVPRPNTDMRLGSEGEDKSTYLPSVEDTLVLHSIAESLRSRRYRHQNTRRWSSIHLSC